MTRCAMPSWIGFATVVPLTLLAALVTGCGTPAPTEPKVASADARAMVGDSQIRIGYRYLPDGTDKLTLFVDVESSGKDALETRLAPEGLTLLEGGLAATHQGSGEHRATFQVVASRPIVTIVTVHEERDAQLASDTPDDDC